VAAEAFFLFLDEKKQKSSQQIGFFAALWPLPCKSGKTTGCNLLPLFSHPALASTKFTMPLPAHRPAVLPYFARSLSADVFIRKHHLI